MQGKSLKITAPTHEKVRAAARVADIPISDLADLLLEHSVAELEAGRIEVMRPQVRPQIEAEA